jgi:predicted dehydrogenase
MLGAGNFARTVLLPAMKSASKVELTGLATASGATARSAGSRFGFRYCASDAHELLQDPAINAIVIATRHHLHARQVIAALTAGKHVFCEKPLCISETELAEIVQAYHSAITNGSGPQLMVGFNRRFSPMGLRLQDFVQAGTEPVAAHYRINAGFLPAWTQDPEQGGGRIIGEICHFVGFLTWLIGQRAIAVRCLALPNQGRYCDDNISATLEFENGSVATITYVANGDKRFSKERVEVFGGGAAAVLDDFRSLTLVRRGRRQIFRSRLRQDKGHRGEWEAFAQAICRGEASPIPFDQLVNVTQTTFAMRQALMTGERITIDTPGFLAAAGLK